MKKGWFITFVDDWFSPPLKPEKCEWGPYKTKKRAEVAYANAKYGMGYKKVSDPFQRELKPDEK